MHNLGITTKYFSLGIAMAMFTWLFVRNVEPAPTAVEAYQIGDYPWGTESREGVDQFPLLPVCSEVPDYGERKLCSQTKMLKFIYDRVRYPEEAKKDGAEGLVVVRFSVDAGGRVGIPVVVRSPHPALAKSAIATMKRMLDKYPVWEAGRIDDKPALMEFNMPIKYVLKDNGTAAVIVGGKIRYQ